MDRAKYSSILLEIEKITKHIIQFVDSDLTFEAKMDYIEEQLTKKDDLLEDISQVTFSLTADDKEQLRAIYDKEQLAIEKMELMLNDYSEELEVLKDQQKNVKKANFVRKKYLLNVSHEAGYFINKKK